VAEVVLKGLCKRFKDVEAVRDLSLSIRDGDTILLGGYISESKAKDKSGVPVLKDIPILGALFRSKSTSNSRSELVILLHVSVLRSPADAGIQLEAEKPASIRAAEQEFADDELERQKQFEKEDLNKKKKKKK